MTWLLAKFVGVPRWMWLLAGAAVLALVANHMIDRTLETAKESGATEQREADLSETVDRVEKANETREAIRDPAGRARYDECVRSARTPANCERLLPRGQEADD